VDKADGQSFNSINSLSIALPRFAAIIR